MRRFHFLAVFIFGLPLASGMAQSDRRSYEEFALRKKGDVEHGREVFAKVACATCHTVDGTSGRVGPDLFAIGDKFSRRDLIRSVLEPSAVIAVGFGTTIIETKSGATFSGVVKQAGETWTELMGVDGKLTRVATDDVAKQSTPPVSLMPEGLQAALSLADFANLMAYLETLRQPVATLAARGVRDEIPRAVGQVTFEPFFSASLRLDRPVWFGEVPGRAGLYAVLENFGRSWLIEKTGDSETRAPLVDLSGVVRGGGATGLLALAFHPHFAKNRKYFLKYQIEENGRISTLIVERKFAPDFRGDSGEPPRTLLKIPGTTQDHNGGCLAFGPDGFLYFGMGDTGPQGDPQGHGQDLSLLLGKLCRIDVDRAEGDLPYAIPADNPFRGQPGVRGEIWALGFREPWRFTFDSLTHDLWLGDVGQDRFEEVGIVRAGENHGWNVIEGFNPYSPRYHRDGATYIPPVLSYSHRVGVSVTGGYVYRGQRAAAMSGWYVFADFETRRVFALTQTDRAVDKVVEIGRAPTRAVSFTEGRDGELYLVGFDAGVIYRLGLENVDPTPLEARSLSDTAEKAAVPWRIARQAPAEGWFRADFDDSAWPILPAGFGGPNTPGAINRTEWRTSDLWLRREFSLPENFVPASTFALRIHHDEDAEVYLNGIEIARLPRWTQGYIELPLNPEATRALRPGRNVLAIHCHQNTGGQYIDCGLVEYVRPKP